MYTHRNCARSKTAAIVALNSLSIGLTDTIVAMATNANGAIAIAMT